MLSLRILFVLKHRNSYDGSDYGYGYLSSGLFNSARFVVDMLNQSGIESKLVTVADNNGIDKEVFEYRPNLVIIEAPWIVPEKFEILQKLHPSVKWIVRGHSEIPFLANEGMAIEWIKKYVLYENVYFSSNSLSSVEDIRNIVDFPQKVLYLPNYYPVPEKLHQKSSVKDDEIQVGCFGAIRPLKNQLIQALAAIEHGNLTGKIVYFHINGTRNEQYGINNLKNIRALFADTKHHLVEHSWLSHKEFTHLLKKMDVSLNVSFSETFNIVSADSVAHGVPLVCSSEIKWASGWSFAEPTCTKSIVDKIALVTGKDRETIAEHNYNNLKDFSEKSRKIWL